MEAVFEQVDARDERFSLNPVFVEVIRVTIGRGDQHYTMRHE